MSEKRDAVELSAEDKVRIQRIEEELADLAERQKLYSNAARSNPVATGAGYRMASRAAGEASELRAEKERILRGTQHLIDEIKAELTELQSELERTHKLKWIKKLKLNKKISAKEEELEKAIRL